MGFLRVLVIALACVGCNESSDPSNAGDGGGFDGGIDGALPDGGMTNDDERMTLSPAACQADVELLREEDFEVREHPWAYKGDFHGFRKVDTADGPRFAWVSLTTDTVLAVTGQAVPGFSEDFSLILRNANSFAIAPDYGSENDPDYPIAFAATAKEDGILGEAYNLIVRSDGAGDLVVSYSSQQSLTLGSVSGPVETVESLSMGPHGDLVSIVDLEGSEERFVVHEASAGSGLRLVLAQGQQLGTGDPDTQRFVGGILTATVSPLGSAIVHTNVVDDAGEVEGTAHLAIDLLTGDVQCLATDTAILCGGVLVADGFEIREDEFSSDGATTAAVLRTPIGDGTLHYKVLGKPTTEEISVSGMYEDWMFSNIKSPKVCSRNNSVYFVGRVGINEELFRIDETGGVDQLTDFGSLHQVAELKGQIPRDVQDWELGYNCDAVLYLWGPSTDDSNQGYEGYWAVYEGGDTIEIIDDTPGRTGENGDLTHVPRARTGLDPNAWITELVRIGPNGELYFVARIAEGEDLVSTYAVATEPVNRCRAPNRVNSDGDGKDAAPGDGRCDTGAMVGNEPECTLRAALEETNAAPGSDVIEFEGARTIALEDALPPVSSRLTLVGPATVDGSALEGTSAGLVVDARDVEVRGLTLRGFPSHGIEVRQGVRLDGVTIEDNCGWGVYAEAPVSLTGQSGVSSVEENGVGDGCDGGGIFVAGAGNQTGKTHISDTIVSNNGGPGIAAVGRLEVTHLTVENNDGDGILVENLGGEVGTLVRHPFGDLRVVGNRGRGISVEGGGFSSPHGNTTIDGNCGWGIEAHLAPVQLGQANGGGGSHVLSNNGVTRTGGGRFFSFASASELSTRMERCNQSGGLSVTGLSPQTDNPVVVSNAAIEENRGPGIATTGRLKIWSSALKGNVGPGILQVEDVDEATALDTTTVEIAGAQSSSTFNLGPGIAIESGSLRITGAASLADNHGAGIEVLAGNITVGSVSGDDVTTVERNASTDRMCKPWMITPQSEWTTAELGECAQQAGAITLEGNITSYRAVVRDNGGPGLSASDPDEQGVGVIDASFGEICDNGAPDEARMSTYNDVSNTCAS